MAELAQVVLANSPLDIGDVLVLVVRQNAVALVPRESGRGEIAPEELDVVLSQMPDVLEGAVAAYRDEIMGERICAVVVPKPGHQPTLDSVREHFATAGLALFKHPERLEVVEQLPRNSVGKVVRGELAQLLATGAG